MPSKPPAAPSARPAPEAPVLPERPEPLLPPFRPLTGRERVLIVVLTLVTVLAIMANMLRPAIRLALAKDARAEAARLAACPPGASNPAPGCPGTTMPVMVLPAPPKR